MLYNRLPRQSSSPWIKSWEYYLLISEIRLRFQWAAGIAMREKRIALWKSKREPALRAWLLLSFVPRSSSFFSWRPRSFFHDRLVECESVVARIQRGLSRQSSCSHTYSVYKRQHSSISRITFTPSKLCHALFTWGWALRSVVYWYRILLILCFVRKLFLMIENHRWKM